MVQILSPWLIPSYQHVLAELGVGKRCTQTATKYHDRRAPGQHCCWEGAWDGDRRVCPGFGNMQGVSDLKKSHFWTKGTEAKLQRVEEWDEGQKGKTMRSFLKEMNDGWRQKSGFKKKTELRRWRFFFPELHQVGILNPGLFGSKMHALFRASWTTEKKHTLVR